MSGMSGMRGYLNEFVFNLALYWVASFCLSLREARLIIEFNNKNS